MELLVVFYTVNSTQQSVWCVVLIFPPDMSVLNIYYKRTILQVSVLYNHCTDVKPRQIRIKRFLFLLFLAITTGSSSTVRFGFRGLHCSFYYTAQPFPISSFLSLASRINIGLALGSLLLNNSGVL